MFGFFFECFHLFSVAYELDFFPGCALICQNVSVASTGCNNVHGSLIPVLSRRVCGFYVYIVSSATGVECLLAALSSATLECSRFVLFFFVSGRGKVLPVFFLASSFNSVRLSSTKSCGQFVLF